jgi:hypothetical protein
MCGVWLKSIARAVVTMDYIVLCCLVRIQGDKNREKLKQWLLSADSAHQKEAEPVEQEDVDDLGTLSDYEFGKIAPVALAVRACTC